ncbi:MAG: AzlC family ABC transporter permease [Pseudomonadota bacterium]
MPQTSTGWFLKGSLAACTLPALVLMGAQIGFAALAREAGFSLWQTLLLTVAVWALPSQVVFVGMVSAGASMAAAALAVALSAVRFMPMMMSWTPLMRAGGASRLALLALSMFVAITAWVFAMAKLPDVPKEDRFAYFCGFALCLTGLNAAVVVVAYNALDVLPPMAAALLVFLMPIYFLMALWGAARSRADYVALGAGIALGPPMAVLVPQVDLLVAGLLAGTLAYAVHRFRRA